MLQHSKKCLSRALLAAIENIRDEQGMTDERFARIVNKFPHRFTFEAENYLEDGSMDCYCRVGALKDVRTELANADYEGVDDETRWAAKDAAFRRAGQWLAAGNISAEEYVQLLRVIVGKQSWLTD